MQAIMETLFDTFYLTSVIFLGYIMFTNNKSNKKLRLIGIMSMILGFGDAFHLVPRLIALFTSGLEAHAKYLGFGKLITSITMTIFYIILYHVYLLHYKKEEKKGITSTLYLLGITRIFLILMPQNDWFNYYAPVKWGIYRNIPFIFIGLIIICLFYIEKDKSYYQYMPLGITLSFLFYIPVVLWAKSFPLVGILMIPKTISYFCIVLMGYREYKGNNQPNL